MFTHHHKGTWSTQAQLPSPASPTRPWRGTEQESRASQGLSCPGRGSTGSLADCMHSGRSLRTQEGPVWTPSLTCTQRE